MNRALPPLKGHLRKKVQPKPSTPPLPENPYKRFFTKQRSFEDLINESAKLSIAKKCRIPPGMRHFLCPPYLTIRSVMTFVRREFYLCCKLWNVPTLLTPVY